MLLITIHQYKEIDSVNIISDNNNVTDFYKRRLFYDLFGTDFTILLIL